MGHGLKDCLQIIPAGKSKISDDPPYTLALKAESKLIGKESTKFNVLLKKVGAQCSYTGGIKLLPNSSKIIVGGNNEIWRLQGNMELMGGEEVLMEQERISVVKEDEKLNDSTKKYGNNSNLAKKASWKRIKPVATMIQIKAESTTRKRKSPEAEIAICGREGVYEDGIKILKHDGIEDCDKVFSEVMTDISEQLDAPKFFRSVAAKRQADRAQ
ncbi:hypothetical protein Gohar_002716 [Gossypium harknessii]|uniref:Uncharacterized protein n=1 Tax=Gossypium harknessii TaxID=34285 RepID=A0A7J9HLQ2_9ROSI|nr:hypothetical protein [Gossypium harknessii]